MAAVKPNVHRQKSILISGREATDLQENYSEGRAMGLEPIEAMAAAGHPTNPGTIKGMESDFKVIDLINRKKRINAINLGLTRDDVLRGMMEAIEQAKLIAEPMTQIAGWREIAKVCGFYAPEVKKIQLSNDAKNYLQRLENLDDEELLRLAEAEIEIIEGELVDDSDAK